MTVPRSSRCSGNPVSQHHRPGRDTGHRGRFRAGDRSTSGAGQHAATTGGPLRATAYAKGTVIVLDPAGSLYAAIGAGNLRAYVQGSDDVGHGQGLAN